MRRNACRRLGAPNPDRIAAPLAGDAADRETSRMGVPGFLFSRHFRHGIAICADAPDAMIRRVEDAHCSPDGVC